MALELIIIIGLLLFIFVKNTEISMPSNLFCLLWTFFILGATFLLGDNKFYFYGIYWILGLCIFISVVSYRLEKTIIIISDNDEDRGKADIPWTLLTVMAFLALLSVGISIHASGINSRGFNGLNSVQSIAYQMTVERYSDSQSGSGMAQILGVFMYAVAICAGYSWVHVGGVRDKVICMICIVPVILSTLITTAKLSLVSFVLLFITGFYISYINRYHRLPHISARVALRFLLMFCFLILIFYITFVFRLNNTVLNPAKIIIGKLAIYMFGHVQGMYGLQLKCHIKKS